MATAHPWLPKVRNSSSTAEPLTRCRAELGESPRWDHRINRLVWVDILSGLVHVTEPETGNTTTIPVDRHVGAVALYAESAYLLAVRAGFAVLDGETMGPVAPAFDDIALRMNDGSVDPLGRFVVGAMAYDASAGRGQLYLREVDGTLRTLIDGVTISNGLAWSATGETIYYVDSATHGVDIFDYDLLDGTMTNRRRHVSIDPEEGARRCGSRRRELPLGCHLRRWHCPSLCAQRRGHSSD